MQLWEDLRVVLLFCGFPQGFWSWNSAVAIKLAFERFSPLVRSRSPFLVCHDVNGRYQQIGKKPIGGVWRIFGKGDFGCFLMLSFNGTSFIFSVTVVMHSTMAFSLWLFILRHATDGVVGSHWLFVMMHGNAWRQWTFYSQRHVTIQHRRAHQDSTSIGAVCVHGRAACVKSFADVDVQMFRLGPARRDISPRNDFNQVKWAASLRHL